jgi:hypothetical protein
MSVALILAVDPGWTQAAAIERLARELPEHELVTTESCAEAIALLDRRVPDLVLLPTLLPEADEGELRSQLHALSGNVCILTIPLLASDDPAPSDNPSDKPSRWFGRLAGTSDRGGTEACNPGVFAGQIREYIAAIPPGELSAPASETAAPAAAAPETFPQAPADYEEVVLDLDELSYETPSDDPQPDANAASNGEQARNRAYVMTAAAAAVNWIRSRRTAHADGPPLDKRSGKPTPIRRPAPAPMVTSANVATPPRSRAAELFAPPPPEPTDFAPPPPSLNPAPDLAPPPFAPPPPEPTDFAPPPPSPEPPPDLAPPPFAPPPPFEPPDTLAPVVAAEPPNRFDMPPEAEPIVVPAPPPAFTPLPPTLPDYAPASTPDFMMAASDSHESPLPPRWEAPVALESIAERMAPDEPAPRARTRSSGTTVRPERAQIRRWIPMAIAATVVGALASVAYVSWPQIQGALTNGTVVLESIPPGSEVFIDGRRIGVAPVTTDLPSGPHTVEFRSADGQKVIEMVVVARSRVVESVDWTATPTGSLQVRSDPPNARVLVDGEFRGNAPLTLDEIAVGEHTVVLQGASGEVRRTVTVAEGRVTEVSELIFTGFLTVFAPFEVQVTEGNRALRLDDRGQMMLPPGRHELRFRNSEFSYDEVRRIDIEPAATTRLSLVPRPTTLSVTSNEPAEVFVDGERLGATPITNASIALGTREVTILAAGGDERRVFVKATAQPVQLDVDFSQPR